MRANGLSRHSIIAARHRFSRPPRAAHAPSLPLSNIFLALLVPVALLLPASAAERPRAAPEGDVAREAGRAGPPPAVSGIAATPFRIVERARRAPVQRQVRIEQRIIIRIGPASEATRNRMLSELSPREPTDTFAERQLDGCVPIDSIAAVRPAPDNRLFLFMRDRRVLTAALERSCAAESFYSGFYIERSPDGALCSRRDQLHSRSGVSCQVARLNRLVAVSD